MMSMTMQRRGGAVGLSTKLPSRRVALVPWVRSVRVAHLSLVGAVAPAHPKHVHIKHNIY